MKGTLSEMAGVGRIVVCESCDQLHLRFGRVTLDLTREELEGLAELLDHATLSLAFGDTPAGRAAGERSRTVASKTALLH